MKMLKLFLLMLVMYVGVLNTNAQSEKKVKKAIQATDTAQFNTWIYSNNFYINTMFDGFSLLHLTVIQQNSTMLDYFLFREAFVNIRNKKGVTPLMLAVGLPSEKIVLQLLSHGGMTNFADLKGRTALYYAVIANKPDRVKLLLDAGADPRRMDDYKKIPADYTENLEILKLLK